MKQKKINFPVDLTACVTTKDKLLVIIACLIIGSIAGEWMQSYILRLKYNNEIESINKAWSLKLKIKEIQYQDLYKRYQILQNELNRCDYEEFKGPDTNNDNLISRYEFSSYISKYLLALSELTMDSFPTFEQFDSNADDYISSNEWTAFPASRKDSSNSSEIETFLDVS